MRGGDAIHYQYLTLLSFGDHASDLSYIYLYFILYLLIARYWISDIDKYIYINIYIYI